MDNNSFEQWQLDGEKTAEQRGIEAAQKMLDSYVPPEIDPGVDEGLREFIAKREEVLPDGVV